MSRITESLYRITGVELDESNKGRANISLVQNLFDEAVNKGLFKEAKNIVEDRNIIVDSDGLKVTRSSACTGAYMDLRKLLYGGSLNESNFHDGSLRDEFYSLIEGMDPQEVISWLLSYINDYDLDDLIRDARKDI